MGGVARRHRALTDEQERQLEKLVDVGIRHALVASALGVSRSTVTRTLARRRAEPETLAQLLARIDRDFDEPPRPGALRRRGRDDWQASARLLEANFPERWAEGAGSRASRRGHEGVPQ
jgi:hypothetical protein